MAIHVMMIIDEEVIVIIVTIVMIIEVVIEIENAIVLILVMTVIRMVDEEMIDLWIMADQHFRMIIVNHASNVLVMKNHRVLEMSLVDHHHQGQLI